MNEAGIPNAASRSRKNLHAYLNQLADRFECPGFITDDPIAIPHRFSRKQDIEIAAFLAAVFAWGQRTTIVAKTTTFLTLMGKSPYEFVVNHRERDRQPFESFAHRTFQPLDALYFLDRLQRHYREHDSLEDMFSRKLDPTADTTETALRGFHEAFFDVDYAPQRTRKHVATPARKSSCKRLNMLLRWMVRPSEGGVDFGLWTKIRPRQLVMPLDVHVQRMSANLGLLSRKQADWQAATELTAALREFDAADPTRYDFALFGLGIEERYGIRE